MKKHNNQNEQIFIGDNGMLKRADIMSRVVVVGCMILSLFLIFLGVMAVIYQVA